MANKLGLGDVTGIDIPGEKQGIIPHHEWKLATHGVVWTPGETVVASIGQGYVLVTPLQLAVMTARLASGTKAVTPSLQTVDGVPEFAELDISPAALRIVHKGMVEVTTGVVVEHGGSGSSMAAPIAKAALKRALETEGKA